MASRGYSSLRCTGFSLRWLLLLWSTGSRCPGSVVVAHGPSCSTACGILPDQGSNLCPWHWQADSQPLSHQGSPNIFNLSVYNVYFLRAQISFLFIYLFIYLFLAALGLHYCAQAFSSCGERGLLFVAVRRLLIAVASLVVEHRL